MRGGTTASYRDQGYRPVSSARRAPCRCWEDSPGKQRDELHNRSSNMDSTLGEKPHSHEHGVLTLPKPQSHENHGLDGEGIMLRAKESGVPTSKRRTYPLGPSRRFGRLLLAPHGTNTTPTRTERRPPQHGHHNHGESTPAAPESSERAREKEGEEEGREGERGSGAWALSPNPVKAT
ncbi:hypothetical protein Taro_027644 [Colocasia esculenta]|uniref:Uncharacterized protein n=1 Tax=Colocasia esculenta TaxID=4460 RepID=A0A843VEF7_COLES|nr:hypothetical protein [Colocasia esculenta]